MYKIPKDKRILLSDKLGIDQKYQHNIITDDSDRIIVNKSRSIGISYAVAFKKLLDCYESDRKQFIFVSQRHDNVLLLLKYVRDFHNDISKWIDVPQIVSDSRAGGIVFTNGSMIISLPTDADAIRSWHGDVWLDEFAFVDNDDKILAVVRGCLKPGRKQLIITSTPDEESGEFFNIWNSAYVKKVLTEWKCMFIPYTECKVKGMIETIEKEREEAIELGRFEEWEREYMGKFTNKDFLMFTRAKLNAVIARNPDGTIGDVPECPAEFGGMDFAKSIDSSVLRTVGKKWKGTPQEKIVVRDNPLRMKEGYTGQLIMIKDFVKNDDIGLLYCDATGVGNRLVEELKESEVSHRIEGVVFDNAWKERAIMFLYSLVSAGKIILPNDKLLIEQLHELRREKTIGDKWRYTHKRSGHDDEVWALCLALQGYINGESAVTTDDVATVNRSRIKTTESTVTILREQVKNMRM